MSVLEPLNEITFVAHLGTVVGVRAHTLKSAGKPVLIASGEVEERQVDPLTGRVKRCDIRLNSPTGRKLASGEMKRPKHPDGRDPRNDSLRKDARRKAVARGLPYYFTCNMADVVLYRVASRADTPDTEEASFQLAPIQNSREVEAHWADIEAAWSAFLDGLEERLRDVDSRRPSATSTDVVAVVDCLHDVANEGIARAVRRVAKDKALQASLRREASNAFGFSVALNPKYPAPFKQELLQVLLLGAFVIAQKLVLYRVLAEAGPRRAEPFKLDPLQRVDTSTDPRLVRDALDQAMKHAIGRSKDYQTALNPKSLEDAVFIEPEGDEETSGCRVGEVWQRLADTISSVSWSAITRNLVGYLYEAIVEPEFRLLLGQHYTREDVVDLLIGFGLDQPGDMVLDPASGGGSFLRASYQWKRELGEPHEAALAQVWGVEITDFAAELATVSLATADTTEPAAYPRVMRRDFFRVFPGLSSGLSVPGDSSATNLPREFDVVVGNPPYISYRRQTNQSAVLAALLKDSTCLSLPVFSGKSDEYAWFLVHATRFLKNRGRLAFVVSSAVLFSDYGIPLVRFLAAHYRIRAVIDSCVERWFPEADTNAVLLWLEREKDAGARCQNDIRFVRLRRPLSKLFAASGEPERRGDIEVFVDEILPSESGDDDPRFMVNVVEQGENGGLVFVDYQGDTSTVMETPL